MVTLWTSIAGAAIVCWTLREVFADLFQPSASGALSSAVGKRVFQLAKRAHWLLKSAGPLSIVLVISLWAMLVTVGFALLFVGFYPGAFDHTAPHSGDWPSRFLVALYFSLANLTTVGSTEFSPGADWIRIVSAIEALIGISLVTASVTWIVLLYPALGRLRTLARRAYTLDRAGHCINVDPLTGDVAGLLSELAHGVLRTRVDFIHFPLLYYFHVESQGIALGRFLLSLRTLAERALAGDQPEPVRLGGAMLSISLSDMGELLQVRFVPQANKNDPREVFKAVARDHLEPGT